jgi:hypothetical protein
MFRGLSGKNFRKWRKDVETIQAHTTPADHVVPLL